MCPNQNAIKMSCVDKIYSETKIKTYSIVLTAMANLHRHLHLHHMVDMVHLYRHLIADLCLNLFRYDRSLFEPKPLHNCKMYRFCVRVGGWVCVCIWLFVCLFLCPVPPTNRLIANQKSLDLKNWLEKMIVTTHQDKNKNHLSMHYLIRKLGNEHHSNFCPTKIELLIQHSPNKRPFPP